MERRHELIQIQAHARRIACRLKQALCPPIHIISRPEQQEIHPGKRRERNGRRRGGKMAAREHILPRHARIGKPCMDRRAGRNGKQKMIRIKGRAVTARGIVYAAVHNHIQFSLREPIVEIGRIRLDDRQANLRILSTECFNHRRQEAGGKKICPA